MIIYVLKEISDGKETIIDYFANEDLAKDHATERLETEMFYREEYIPFSECMVRFYRNYYHNYTTARYDYLGDGFYMKIEDLEVREDV